MSRKRAHKSKPWMCGACKVGFDSQRSAEDHARMVHKSAAGIGIYKRVAKVDGAEHEPSFADRAVQAGIDRAMGIPTDDEWLLGED